MTSPTPHQTPPPLRQPAFGHSAPTPPEDSDPTEDFLSNMSTGKKLSWVDRFCGIGVSVVIHLIILVVFSGVTLISSGEDFGTEEGTVAETIIYDNKEKEEITSQTDTEIQINNSDSAVTKQEVSITQVDTVERTNKISKAQAPGETEVTDLQLNSNFTGENSKTAGTNTNWSGFSGRRGQGGGGNFFNMKITGSDVVYLIDLSGSMDRDRLSAAKRELVRSIKSLSRTSKFCVIFYNEEITFIGREPKLVRATRTNKTKYVNWIQNDENLTGKGGTYPSEAIAEAYDLMPDTIILLTDGVFLKPEKVTNVIKTKYNANPIKIHSIAYFSNEGEPLLRKISEEMTGGDFKHVDRQSVLGN